MADECGEDVLRRAGTQCDRAGDPVPPGCRFHEIARLTRIRRFVQPMAYICHIAENPLLPASSQKGVHTEKCDLR